MANDIFGKALQDYQDGKNKGDLLVHSDIAETEILPLPYLFRDFTQMPKIEQMALKKANGRILDVGCGAGSHLLYLQEQGLEVVGLDKSPGAIHVCQQRGVEKLILGDFFTLNNYSKFDTLLFLMNGIGIIGSLQHLNTFFTLMDTWLQPGGQVLFDSCDVLYMYKNEEDDGFWVPDDHYYGEVAYQFEYLKEKTEIFPWIFIDFNTFKRAAMHHGYTCTLLQESSNFEYLARISRKVQ